MGHQLVKTDILLAVWQGEKYLPSLLQSLRDQTNPSFHVIYQDDGSRDSSIALLEEIAGLDSRFTAGLEQGLHLGAAGNFLSLLRQSRADYIFLCDQDDIWEAQKIERMQNIMQQEETVTGKETPLLIHSDCTLIDGEGKVTAPSFFRLQGWDPSATSLAQLLVQNNATGCTMMLNRALADLVIRHGRASDMFMHDWFIALTAAAFGKIVFLDQPLVRYRQHENNAIGASHASLLRRGSAALRKQEEAKARIALTYSHSRAFLSACDADLPAPARNLIKQYLATEKLPKIRRILEIRRLGCVMQSPITRIGQVFFG